MSQTLIELQKQLDDALQLIHENDLLSDPLKLETGVSDKVLNIEFAKSDSLLAQCEQVCEQFQSEKPTLRIIHHFACSGGTLVSKCLSAMPNVFLLSEVHPYTDLQNNKAKPQYSPSDLSKLAIYAGVPEQKKLAGTIFIESVKAAHQHIDERGGILILRDHSHSDYCVGKQVHENTIVELLKDHFNIISLVTLRNPIDSYLSLVENGWGHFQPATFDEYCARLLAFLSHFKKEQIVFYEDFVQQPQQVLKQMSSKLKIPFDGMFECFFDVFSVTGDSGRKGIAIETRERREIADDLLLKVKSSENFRQIATRFSMYKTNVN